MEQAGVWTQGTDHYGMNPGSAILASLASKQTTKPSSASLSSSVKWDKNHTMHLINSCEEFLNLAIHLKCLPQCLAQGSVSCYYSGAHKQLRGTAG